MDNRELRTLRLLEEIDKGNAPSQRELAKKLNASLGLVNSFIKRLSQKGYFKITTIPKNRVNYILTPKGAAEKARLTYEYIQYSFNFYRTARQKLRDLFKDLAEKGERHVVFYGVNDLAEIAFISLQEISLQIVAVVDDNKVGGNFLGYLIEDPAMINSFSFDKIFITAMKSRAVVLKAVLEKGVPREKVIMLD